MSKATKQINSKVEFDSGLWLQRAILSTSAPTFSTSSAVVLDHRKKEKESKLVLLHPEDTPGNIPCQVLYRNFLNHSNSLRSRVLSHFADEKTEVKKGVASCAGPLDLKV